MSEHTSSVPPAPDQPELPQPLPLLIAHARGADRAWHALCWHIDDRMARIVLTAREGAVAAIRLAWWEEALTSDGSKGRGEPMLERWHAAGPGEGDRGHVHAMAAAWRMLLDPEPMGEAEWAEFGRGRGALFPLIARGGDAGVLGQGGAVWALWDVARRDPDRQRGEGAFAAAILAGEEKPRPRIVPRPLSLAVAMAMDDVRERTLSDLRFTPRQYIRLLRRAIFG
ncbi:hypothetical protein LWE61_14695 [Sphingobium sufflavum]|uniref:hypothetical protein n=1 Tax=Sphingobium sufflavum TaxID=1129547 RepID=UPI001F2B7C0E|nr:hypothetical protein [Sphingobium sufflavum]MCE7797797.1 hypothetical protein [Sphingobium sufflavum]